MKHLIGDKNIFAIEFEILDFNHGLNSHVLIWINNRALGNYSEVGYFNNIIWSLNRIIKNGNNLWLEELNNLECKDLFYAITPFYNNPDSFFDLSQNEQEALIKYDIFMFYFGDGFDDWIIRATVQKRICKFLWVYTPLRGEDSFEVRNNIQCFDVNVQFLDGIYSELKEIIPINHFPLK